MRPEEMYHFAMMSDEQLTEITNLENFIYHEL